MQQHKAHGVPHRLVQKRRVVVFPCAGDGVVQPHAEEAVRRRAEGFPVDEVAPPANGLADEKAQRYHIQQSSDFDLLDAAQQQNPRHCAQNAAVNGKATVPDVQHGNGVLGVIRPGENAVIRPGAKNSKGRDPQHTVQQIVLLDTELTAPAAGVDYRQHQTDGDNEAVIMDGQRPQRQGAAGVHLNAKGRERNG